MGRRLRKDLATHKKKIRRTHHTSTSLSQHITINFLYILFSENKNLEFREDGRGSFGEYVGSSGSEWRRRTALRYLYLSNARVLLFLVTYPDNMLQISS